MKTAFMGVLAAALICALVTCHPTPKHEGTFFASIEVMQEALADHALGTTGYFFFIQNENSEKPPLLVGYEYDDGHLKNTFGGNPESTEVIQKLRAVGLEPFNFQKEITKTIARLNQEAKQRGEDRHYHEGIVLDGAEYRVRIRTPSGMFSMKKWNPGYAINSYARHSKDVGKLKSVLDQLAQFSGRENLGL
jgi:hypothetical protein